MTSPRPAIAFPPYRLDVKDSCLWRGDTRIALSATDSAVLAYLASRPGQLVTHEELLAAQWPGVAVAPGLLKVRVRRLRQALGDRADRPRFIETVYGRGYRFIAAVTGPRARARPLGVYGRGVKRVADPFVGRDAELDVLRHYLDQAIAGERQIVFVAGEPGVGKSALMSEFLARAVDAEHVWVGYGQCIESHGAAEAYMPMLEALGRACRGPGGGRLQRRFRTLAPSWLAQMRALLTAREAEALRRATAGATRERMVRELAEALDVVTTERPMVLWLEDLHWSDVSSLTLLSALAQRPEAARLLIVATYRPVDALGSNQLFLDLLRDLETHGRCRSLRLDRLAAPDVAAYLGARFPDHAFPAPLAAVLYRRTEGHPLFLVGTVQDLVAAGDIAEVAGHWTLKADVDALHQVVPATIRHLVHRQRQRLSPSEQEMLAAASVVGAVFGAPLVAAALEWPVTDVEDVCAGLAERQQFVRPSGDVVHWPDGTALESYAFLHAVYQALWQERVRVSTRRVWHQRIAERLERAYGDQAGDIAAELAMHFEAAGSYEIAIRYLRRASANAVRRSAPHEAILLARKGLTLLGLVADPGERTEMERELRIALGRVQLTTGYAGPEELENYARLRELCRDAGNHRRLLAALVPLARFYANCAEFQTARELGAQALRIAQASPERLGAAAHAILGAVEFHLGELAAAREHLESALSLHDPPRSEMLARLYGENVEVPSLGHRAVVLWYLGYPDQALVSSRAALTAARSLDLPVPRAFALSLAAWVHRLRREPPATRSLAAELIALSTEYGFPFWMARGTFELGWSLAAAGRADEGRALMQDGLARYSATGARMHYVGNVIAQIDVAAEYQDNATKLATVTELLADVESTGQRHHEPTLYRLKGELVLDVTHDDTAAEACFQHAIEVAVRQGATLPELQATLSLARLWRRRGRTSDAHAALGRIYQWFTEGFDTSDLQDARALVDDLAGR